MYNPPKKRFLTGPSVFPEATVIGTDLSPIQPSWYVYDVYIHRSVAH